MSNTPHELAQDFPEYAQTISKLRQSDAHFSKLAEEYHALNGDIHRAETDVEPTSDDHVAEMRRQRVVLKDQLYALMSKDAASA